MRALYISLVLVGTSGVVGALPACGSSSSGDSSVADGGTDGPATADGDASVDPCVEDPTAASCLNEDTSWFVSPNGDDTGGDGSRAKPLKTIGAAIAKVSAARNRIYACEGVYAEAVTIGSSLSLFGGVTCDFKAKGGKAKIAPADGVALTIASASDVAVTDVDVDAHATAQKEGASAIAIFVSSSKNVRFRRVAATAGPGNEGSKGADGTAAPNFTVLIATGGETTATATGAPAPTCGMCADKTYSIGGKGADKGGFSSKGDAMPSVGTDNAGTSGGGATCTAGNPGANGAAGAPAKGGPTAGVVAATGWNSTATAAKGSNGNPGQGGGGGGSTGTPALGGGSGGCGGCGGTGGGPGGNGGSSFALLAFQSEITAEESSFTADAGGRGGKGGDGEDGQTRGGPGNGACAGGFGGHGAGGGGGGGGAGGHSGAVAYVGTAPKVDGCTLAHGKGGDVGAGGSGGQGQGNHGNGGGDGAVGKASDLLQL